MSPKVEFSIGKVVIDVYIQWSIWTIGVEFPRQYNYFTICVLPLAISFHLKGGE